MNWRYNSQVTQEELDSVLIDITDNLRVKLGIEAGANYQGSIIAEGAVSPAKPIIPEDVSQIIKNALEAKGLKFNFTEWPITVNNKNGNLVIRYTP